MNSLDQTGVLSYVVYLDYKTILIMSKIITNYSSHSKYKYSTQNGFFDICFP